MKAWHPKLIHAILGVLWTSNREINTIQHTVSITNKFTRGKFIKIGRRKYNINLQEEINRTKMTS